MRSTLRGTLMLGTAFATLSMTPAFADDPLLPEGADRPKMGKELVLPPAINEAPPNTPIVLPPPGQEHLLGQRPANAVVTEKTEARLADEPVESVTADAASKPAKKGKRNTKSATQTAKAETAPIAPVAGDKAVLAGLQKTSVPDQSLVVAEGAQNLDTPKIEQTNQRMADLTKPAMGGPELAGPPSPQDGMAKTPAPIRDGDTLDSKQANALVAQNDASNAKPQSAPAIERFEIAQATSAPMPVTPPKTMGSAGPDWDVEISGAVGYGRVESAAQNYFGEISRNNASMSARGNWNRTPLSSNLVTTDDEDDTFTYEAAARFNLTGSVEPLGGGSNVTPYVKIGVSGYDAEFRSSHGRLTAGEDSKIVAAGTGNDVEDEGEYKKFDGWHGGYDKVRNHKFNLVDNIQYRGDENMIRALLEYGQTWHGSSGVDITGFAQIAYTWRDYSHTLTFDAFKKGRRLPDLVDVAFVDEDLPPVTHRGVYQTDLDSNTASFGLGTAISVPLSSDRRWRADANVRGSYDITSVDGTDSLGVSSVFNNAPVAQDVVNGGFDKFQRIHLRKTEESFGYGGGVGISYQVSQTVGVRLGADYSSQEAAPVVVRDGVNPSRIELEREDVLVGTLTATIKF